MGKPVADISVAIPTVRPKFIPVVLRAFELGDVLPAEVLLVSNEVEAGSLRTYEFPVRILQFSSDTYGYGVRDIALRRNIGVWDCKSPSVLCFDDDEVPTRELVGQVAELLKTEAYVWGHHRIVDFDEPTSEQEAEALIAKLQSMPAEAGRSRECAANRVHLYMSGYGGLFACNVALLKALGGFDMVHNCAVGEDQAVARQLARFVGGGKAGADHIFVFEPPFAWGTTKQFGLAPMKRNVCVGTHEFVRRTWAGMPMDQCTKCPLRQIPNLTVSDRIVLPFDRSAVSVWETTVRES